MTRISLYRKCQRPIFSDATQSAAFDMDYSAYQTNYTTNYGAGGAMDGGGFVGGEAQSSPATGKGYGEDTLRPVTIKQMLSAHLPHPDAKHKIDNDIVNAVTFVGQIRNINHQTTHVTYKVDDGTGIIEVKHWAADDQSIRHNLVDVPTDLSENMWVRVWGRLKSFNDKQHVLSNFVRSINDYNEIHYHLLQAVAVHLFFTRGVPGQQQTNGATGQGVGGYDGQIDIDGALPSYMGPKTKQVYEWLKRQPDNNEGFHVDQVASGMRIPPHQAQECLQELSLANKIFATVDESTFAIIE